MSAQSGAFSQRSDGSDEVVASLSPWRGGAQIRRSTLVFIRWISTLIQAVALYTVTQLLAFPLPVREVALIVAVSLLMNIVITFTLPLDRRITTREATVQLGYDILQFSALLYFVGGLSNPFALLLIAPVVTGATTLSLRTMAILFLMVAACAGFLVYYHLPLPSIDPSGFDTPLSYRFGVWIALMTGSGLTSLYAWRAASESRRMSAALSATEHVLAREQRLAALGGLAAAAAHELGTPLATIQVVAKEIARDVDPASPMGEDAKLLLEQSQRCREILTRLTVHGDAGDVVHDRITVRELITEVIEPFISSNKTFVIRVEGDLAEPNVSIRRRPELLYGLRNFVENAVSFARDEILIASYVTREELTLVISDDGPGFDPLIKDRLGEPYVTSRPDRQKKPGYAAGGLGLGLFIAKTLIKRTEGRVRFEAALSGGAEVRLRWPLKALQDDLA